MRKMATTIIPPALSGLSLLLPVLLPRHPDLVAEPLESEVVELRLPGERLPQPGLRLRAQRGLLRSAGVAYDWMGREKRR